MFVIYDSYVKALSDYNPNSVSPLCFLCTFVVKKINLCTSVVSYRFTSTHTPILKILTPSSLRLSLVFSQVPVRPPRIS